MGMGGCLRVPSNAQKLPPPPFPYTHRNTFATLEYQGFFSRPKYLCCNYFLNLLFVTYVCVGQCAHMQYASGANKMVSVNYGVVTGLEIFDI